MREGQARVGAAVGGSLGGGARLLLSCALAALAPGAARAEDRVEETQAGAVWTVFFDKVPSTLDEFRALRDKLCTKPQGAIGAFLVAMMVEGKDTTLGEQCLALTLDGSLLEAAGQRPNADGKQLGAQVVRSLYQNPTFNKHLAYAGEAYVEGMTAENGYVLPASGPHKIVMRQQSGRSRDASVWTGMVVNSFSGPKPFAAKQTGDQWRVSSAQAFFVGLKPSAIARPAPAAPSLGAPAETAGRPTPPADRGSGGGGAPPPPPAGGADASWARAQELARAIQAGFEQAGIRSADSANPYYSNYYPKTPEGLAKLRQTLGAVKALEDEAKELAGLLPGLEAAHGKELRTGSSWVKNAAPRPAEFFATVKKQTVSTVQEALRRNKVVYIDTPPRLAERGRPMVTEVTELLPPFAAVLEHVSDADLTKLKAELDERAAYWTKKAEEVIDATEWEAHDESFQGDKAALIADVKRALTKQYGKDFVQPLAIRIAGTWEICDRNLVGEPTRHRILLQVAWAATPDGRTADSDPARNAVADWWHAYTREERNVAAGPPVDQVNQDEEGTSVLRRSKVTQR